MHFHIFSGSRDVLGVIFNKFRIFLGIRYLGHHMYYLYSGKECCKKEYKLLSAELKILLYNYRTSKKDIIFTDNNIPDDNNHIWKHLSKTFTWTEAASYISIMDDIGVDFNWDLGRIYNFINAYDNISIRSSLLKIRNRIQNLIRHNTDNNAISSEDDEYNYYVQLKKYDKQHITKKPALDKTIHKPNNGKVIPSFTTKINDGKIMKEKTKTKRELRLLGTSTLGDFFRSEIYVKMHAFSHIFERF